MNNNYTSSADGDPMYVAKKEKRKEEENKLGLSCAKLSSRWG
jgi:hypothetical protein